MVRGVCWPLTMILIGSAANSARAQPPPSAFFVTAGGFADIQLFGHADTRSTTPTSSFVGAETDPSGTAGGFQLGIGTNVAPRVSLRFEVGISSSRHKALRPAQNTPPPPNIFSTRQEIDYRVRDVGTTAAYHLARRWRIQPGLIGGFMYFQERGRTLTITTMTPPGTTSNMSETVSTIYRAAATAGLEAEVRVVKGLAVVPDVRVNKTFGVAQLLVRPGVSAKWSF
jgi:hypothetical protein